MENKEKLTFELNEEKFESSADILLDSDNDGIPDDWEINGYTVENGKIVKWIDGKHLYKGFVKYFSNPYDSHTAGDPYSDSEKVLGKIDGLKEAMHPLVAAYPRISVELEKIILSKNITTTSEEGKTTGQESSNTVGISTNNSHTDSTINTISTNIDLSLAWSTGIGYSVSHNWSDSNETSNTVSTENNSSDTTGTSLSSNIMNSLSLNQAEAAFLNANIRYVNFGTAPIYNLKPTINFVLGNDKNADTLTTIKAKENTIAKVVYPGEKYPSSNHNAVSWNTSDDFNFNPIKLNYDQVRDLVDWKPLEIQVTQIEGEYKKYNLDGDPYTLQDFKWEYAFSDIYNKTALITFAFADGRVFERRIAARQFKDFNSQKHLPKMSIKEALELAFGGMKLEPECIVYQNTKVDYSNLHIILNQETIDIMKEFDNKKYRNSNDLFGIFLTKEMKIMFIEEKPIDEQIIFNQIVNKIGWFYGGKDKYSCFDFKNEISFDTVLDQNWTIIKSMIKKELLGFGFPADIVKRLDIEWANGQPKSSLRNDQWKLFDDNSWFKTIRLVLPAKSKKIADDSDIILIGEDKKDDVIKSDPFRIYFKNVAFEKIEDFHQIFERFSSELNTFEQQLGNYFDFNYCCHANNDFGPNKKYLQEVFKSYFLFKRNIPMSILDKIELEILDFDNNENEKAKFAGIMNSHIRISYQNTWSTRMYLVPCKNLASSWSKVKTRSDKEELQIINPKVMGGFIEGFETFFKDWFKKEPSEIENFQRRKRIAEVLNIPTEITRA